MKIELYEYPLIMHSMQYFEFANELAKKINADKKILDKEHTEENREAFNKNMLVYHCLVVDGKVINGSISESNLRYQQDGWFIWLQSYNFTTSFPYSSNDELFTYWFDKYFDKHFSNVDYDGGYLVETIINYKMGSIILACVGFFH